MKRMVTESVIFSVMCSAKSRFCLNVRVQMENVHTHPATAGTITSPPAKSLRTTQSK
ncbi:hypothetical protein Pla8534_09100 [Lignipirellula cremea]|uniref:Uncharacterized protein n=1 Tax=Lignipirellula cremea TaxID=2528010 RepID=A0A518DMT7_9BACT|nr:hypothetical protein Pla8534_09100 [Lignipirellula cremea]